MMKEDKLRRFMMDNREAFDDAEPPLRTWNRIEKQLPSQQARAIRLWKYSAVAAVALLLVAMGVIIGMSTDQNSLSNSPEWAEYQETEKYYSNQVNAKMENLREYQHDPSLDEDMRQLDEVYADLKTELKQSENPNKKILIDAMIINYRTKLSILEKVLEKLEEEGNDENINEKSDENEM